MNQKPLVSVCMITYNHEKYIAQAIEGVLMQETDFPVELVIGEDCSTDRTRDICEEYQSRFPDVIRLLPGNTNLGMMPNFIRSLEACEGEFVALCEGDDYWTDPAKLRTQVSFLEEFPHFAGSYHAISVVNDKDEPIIPPRSGYWEEPLTFEELALNGCRIPTGSFLYRKANIVLPEWAQQAALGDLIMFLLVARNGSIHFHNVVMGAYRRHSEGVWSSNSWAANLPGYVATLEMCREHFNPVGYEQFSAQLERTYPDMAIVCYENGDFQGFRTYHERSIKTGSRNIPFRVWLALLRRSVALRLRNK